MKQKLSITIDEEKIRILESLLKEGRFRNKSHIVEYSLDKFLRGEENDE
jgi:Arc/MetJ-type ribon-helix-helix transcriptional regulator